MKSLLITLTVILSSLLQFEYAQAEKSQAPDIKPSEPVEILWQKAIGSPEVGESVTDILALPDGGAILVYWRDKEGTNFQRVDKNGNKLWEKVYVFKEYKPHIRKIALLDDGSVIGVGSIYLKAQRDQKYGKSQPFALKISSDGEVISAKHYPTKTATTFTEVEVTQEGELIFAGEMGLPHPGWGGAIYILKVDEDGDPLWQHYLGPYKTETSFKPYYLMSMVIDENDQLIVNARYGGRPNGYSVYDDMVFVLARFSHKGKLLSESEFGDEGWEQARDAVIDENNNMIIGGGKSFDDKSRNGMYFSAFTSGDKILWERVINKPIKGAVRQLRLLPNGNLIGGGQILSVRRDQENSEYKGFTDGRDIATLYDMFFISLTGSGEYLWSKQYSNLGNRGVKAMDVTADGYLWVVGDMAYTGINSEDIYLAKMAVN